MELRKLSDIQLYPGDFRQNDAAVDAVASSIRQFGFCQPIVVDAEGIIICGHTREQRNMCVRGQRRGPPLRVRYFQAGGPAGFRPRRAVLLHVQRGEKEVSKNGARYCVKPEENEGFCVFGVSNWPPKP